ncbi:MAG TPA: serine--tRNA ligase [Solirubrobacteraceae bacterium]|nr:serine--tRNA ligase [Solirubrobacteraceae bacterium]
MLDLRRIREDPDGVRAALRRRDAALEQAVSEVLELDAQWRGATTEAETLRARQRERSEEIARAKRSGADAEDALAHMKQLSVEVKSATELARAAEERLQAALVLLPNLPDPSAADGPDDELITEVGAVPRFDFAPRDHLALAGGRIDMERAARLSGSRFAYLKGELVTLELALVSWALAKLSASGFQPVIPPVLVRERALLGTGFLPDTEQQIYTLPEDELFLVGTSEVALASLHDGEILEQEQLPLRYGGFSPCFRREAGAAGKDTHGIFRVHQFDKVEMFSFVAPERSGEEHERILAIEEQILQELGLPYRVVNIAVRELGSSAAKKFDCEAWIPSEGRYRELTSCSNTTDYQARRLDIRMRAASAGEAARRGAARRTETVHTLNGTAVAVGRTIIALLENGQREDGSVALPEALRAHGAPSELAPATADLRPAG